MIDDDDRWRTQLLKLLLDEEADDQWGYACHWLETVADGFLFQGRVDLAGRFYRLSDDALDPAHFAKEPK